jgi:D-Tyr-tRNAtyr deacylase
MVSSIGKGILVFAAMAPGDTEKEADSLAAKLLKLRLWDDESGRPVRFLSHTTDTALSRPTLTRQN